MQCRQLTPDYFAEICVPDLLLSDIEDRIGGTLLELALMPEAEYVAAVREHPLEFFSLLGCAHLGGQIDEETMLGVIADLPDDIEAVMLEAAFFTQTQSVGVASPPAVH